MKRITRVLGMAFLGLLLVFFVCSARIEKTSSQTTISSTNSKTHSSILKDLSAQSISSAPDLPAIEKVEAQDSKVEEKSAVTPFDNFVVDVGVEDAVTGAKITDGNATPDAGQLEVVGIFTLGASTNGADLFKEHLTLTVGPLSTIIPAGSFKKTAKGIRFKRVVDCILWDLVFQPPSKNKFEFKLELEGETKPWRVKPEQVALYIGDDGGRAKAY